MYIDVSGRSVLMFNKLIDWLILDDSWRILTTLDFVEAIRTVRSSVTSLSLVNTTSVATSELVILTLRRRRRRRLYNIQSLCYRLIDKTQCLFCSPVVWGNSRHSWGLLLGDWELGPQRGPGAEPLVRGSTEAESFSLHKYLTFAL